MKAGDQKALRFSWPCRLHHHVCQALNAIKEPYVKQGPLTLKHVQSMRPDRDDVVYLDSHQLCHDRRRFKIIAESSPQRGSRPQHVGVVCRCDLADAT